MKKARILSVILAAVLLLTACSGDIEPANSKNGRDKSSTSDSRNDDGDARGDASSSGGISSLTQSSNSDTSDRPDSSAPNSSESKPEAPERLKKIPLTDEELFEINQRLAGSIYVFIADHFYIYAENGKSFDCTVSIDNVGMLGYVIDRLLRIIEKDEADVYEKIEIPDSLFGGTAFYYFTPETLERLIQKYFLPSFEISSLDYTQSPYWDAEKGQIKAEYYGDFDQTGNTPFFAENGYTDGEYYYLSAVFSHDTSILYAGEDLFRLSSIPAEYFELPRVQLKVKKFTVKRYDDYYDNCYIIVGFDPTDERAEWVKTAEYLYNTVNWNYSPESPEIIPMPFPSYISTGVIDGSLGKRVYTNITSYRDEYAPGLSTDYTGKDVLYTYGLHGENDVISCEIYYDGYHSSGEVYYNDRWGVMVNFGNDVSITVEDKFKGETYKHTYSTHTDYYIAYDDTDHETSVPIIKNEKFTLNDVEISESDFYSAEIVRYFDEIINLDSIYEKMADEFVDKYFVDFDEDRLLYEHTSSYLDEFTLGDLYEMARIMTE